MNSDDYQERDIIDDLIPISLPTAEEYEKLKNTKKIDANDDARDLLEEDFLNKQDELVRTAVILKAPEILRAGELVTQFPDLRPIVIDKIVRRGEILNLISSPKMGKCIAAGTLIADPITGCLLKIEDVVKNKSPVFKFSFDDRKIVPTKPVGWHKNGEMDCVTLTTRLGNKITLTNSHPLLTPEGWKKVKDLLPGDHIAIPTKIPGPITPERKNISEIVILSVLLSEGTFSGNHVGFSTADPDYLNMVINHANELGFLVKKISKYDYDLLGGAKALLRKYGLDRERAKEKRIPQQVFSLPNEQLRIFLSVFWWGDGGKDGAIGLASEGLIDDLKHLLLRFGIIGRKTYKKSRCNGKDFDSWKLRVHSVSRDKFKEIMCDIGGDKGRFIQAIPNTVKRLDNIDRSYLLEHQIKEALSVIKKTLSTEYRKLSKKIFKIFKHTNYKGRVGKRILRHILSDLVREFPVAFKDVAWLCSEEIFFDDVVSIENHGKSLVYDVSVTTDHCFVASDIIVHNSWIGHGMAMSIVTGSKWLGSFDCTKGRVLLIDNELHPETIAYRLKIIADAYGIPMEYLNSMLDVYCLRGRNMDVYKLKEKLSIIPKGEYSVVILDAFYRFMPPKTDENDNGSMTEIYNAILSVADMLDCAFVMVHHTAKGIQANKAVTDVGAGAGAQSRATDTHFILRPHEEDGVIVVDAAVRSFAPLDPFCIKFDFPVWSEARGKDAARLKGLAGPGGFSGIQEPRETIVDVSERVFKEVLTSSPQNDTQLMMSGARLKPPISKAKIAQSLKILEEQKRVTKNKGKSSQLTTWSLSEVEGGTKNNDKQGEFDNFDDDQSSI